MSTVAAVSTRINTRIPEDLRAGLAALMKDQNLSVSEAVRVALGAGLAVLERRDLKAELASAAFREGISRGFAAFRAAMESALETTGAR